MTGDVKKESPGLGVLIGELALKHRLIDQETFEKTLKACSDAEDMDKALPAYFIAMNLITENEIKKLTAVAKTIMMRRQDINFGDIAMEMGIISGSMLETALKEQTSLFKKKRIYIPLGEILVDAGMMAAAQRDIILKEQNRLKEKKQPHLTQNTQNKENHDDGESDNSCDTFGKIIMPRPKIFAESEVFPCGIKLIIQTDAMAAFLFKTEKFDPLLTIGRIKEILASRNIIFGIAKDPMIARFIQSDEYKKKAFKIARGVKPVMLKNASIQYFFERNHMKPGSIREDGTMDFRDRGDIPQVKKNAVLAVKQKPVQGKNGKNIFNDTIQVNKARDVFLKPGKGTILSDDGLKIIATCSGHPSLSKNGVINVLETYTVERDVDFETGHIDYHGNVIVKGCIENGFKVKANSIWAESIDGGIVTADENITVKNGITDAKITLRGSLSARFIQNSRISCLGDVITEKEVVESQIECNGICNIKGVVIASGITAKMGVHARQIGMEKSPASTIKTGIDIFAQKNMSRLEKRLVILRNKARNTKNCITELQAKIHGGKAKTNRVTAIHKSQQVRIRDILFELSSLDNDLEAEKVQRLELELEALATSNEETKGTMISCEASIANMTELISENEAKLISNEQEIQSLIDRQKELDVWINNHPGVAIIKVQDTIMPGTVICGRYAQDVVAKEDRGVLIKEGQTFKYNGPEYELWKMYIIKG